MMSLGKSYIEYSKEQQKQRVTVCINLVYISKGKIIISICSKLAYQSAAQIKSGITQNANMLNTTVKIMLPQIISEMFMLISKINCMYHKSHSWVELNYLN